LFADPGIEKVFHAADYDIACLKRDFGWSFANLFDTQWAARILGWPQVGLASILKAHFNVHVNKKWQRFNWGERPLPAEALDYARLDTHYLLPLRDRLLTELRSRGRLEEAREVFAELTAIKPHFTPFTPDDFWRIRGAWDLDPQGQAILRRLAIWRDREARRRNRPPFKVLGDSTLVALAQVRPDRMEAMQGVPGLKGHHIHRYGPALLRAIREGKKDPPPSPPPRPPRPDEIVILRYEALREWRRRVAARRGVDPDVVVSNAALWTIASHAPSSLEALAELGVLGPWKLRTYGKALIQVLHS
ncbi:MAG: ribonuclease D, partial [Chloroflexi bacterium]